VLGVGVFVPMVPGLAVLGTPKSDGVDEAPFAAVAPFAELSPRLIGGGFFFVTPGRPRAAGWFVLMEVVDVVSRVGLLGGGAGLLSVLRSVDGVPVQQPRGQERGCEITEVDVYPRAT